MNVTLLKPHRHAGRDCAIDAVIDVTAAEAEWLAAQGVIALPIDTDPPKTTTRRRRGDHED